MASPTGVRISRQQVVEWAERSGCTDARLRTIALLTTEVVTNAVRHGPTHGEVTVSAISSSGGWYVAVSDESVVVPVLRPVEPLSVGGRGILLVDRLASAWGVDTLGARGKTVWFRVARWPEE
ncbi:MAG TPA: ATP-binding protein [Actinomycetales bacterium]|nr:ATP-binding protein [Actinomycetales bacterium]